MSIPSATALQIEDRNNMESVKDCENEMEKKIFKMVGINFYFFM